MPAHKLYQDGGLWHCRVCRWKWASEPRSDCPGVERFTWWEGTNPPPDHLLTKNQMNDAGFTTGKQLPPPAGVISREDSPGGWLRLYSREEGVPKRTMSPAQKAALEKAHAAYMESWKCPQCGRQARYRFSLCSQCEWEIEQKERQESINRMWQYDRREIVEWSRSWLADPEGFVVFDTETTGLGPSDEIVQASLIDQSGEVLVDTFIRPQDMNRLMTGGAMKIHGIGPDRLADAPTFPEVYETLFVHLSVRQVVVYNASFDFGRFCADCRRHDLPQLPFEAYRDRWACAMHAYAAFYGDWSDYFHDYRWQPLPGGDHSALGDCHATLDLLREMAEAEIIEEQ